MKNLFQLLIYGLLISSCTLQKVQKTNLNDNIIQVARTYYLELLPERSPSNFKVVHNDGKRAVVSLVHTSPAIDKGKIKASAILTNFYMYLKKENTAWKVTSSSGGLQTGMRMSGDYARTYSAKEIVEQTERKNKVQGVPEYRVERMRNQYILATSLDSVLINHFNKNKFNFETLKEALQTLNPRTKNRYYADHFPKEDMLKHFNKALIEYVDYIVLPDEVSENSGCNGQDCFTLTLAFSPPFYKVGYFYLNEPERVPQMSAKEYLIVHPLGDSWYFFRIN